MDFLIEKLNSEYNKETVDRIISGLVTKKTTFRVNNILSSYSEIEKVLNDNNIKYSNVSWYKDAFILEEDSLEKLKELDIYESGKIYVQSLSSMIPALVVNPKENESILDMASAPGGKTTQMYSMSNGKSLITACEMNKIRFDRLKYNIDKQKCSKVSLMNIDSRNLDSYFTFDKILLDSPCSGSGTLIQNSNNIKYFTQELVNKSVNIQNTLLLKALSMIKVNSELIYSTCSILKEENDNRILELVNKGLVEVLPLNIDTTDIPKLPSLENTLCVCPTKLYEGFYVVRLKKIK